MFFTAGLPFNLARNPYYMSAFTYAANHNLTGYIPLGYNKLRIVQIQQEKENIETLMQPIKNTWREKGVTIVSDGWSDPQRRPLINFMATSGCGPILIKSVNCFGEVKDKHFIADLKKQVIDEVGAMNVVQIITDNAPNCKGAGEIIESRFPWIYWTPCVVHTLNLALKNICAPKNLDSNQETYDECHWITEVHMRTLFRRFKLIRRALETMVVREEWTSYREDDQGKARFVKEKVTSDALWEKVEYIVAFTGPIYDMIRICDTDKPTLHLVYEMWDTMIEKVKLEIILMKACNMINNLTSMKFYSDMWLHEDPDRVSSHSDAEIYEGRIKCFRKLFPDPQDFKQAMEEFGMFSFKSGPYTGGENLHCRSTMDPILWWASFGSSTPIIHVLALRVLGQPTSSSCCKRNWSTYNLFIY
ncbi:uncharacterized protein LOC110710813 [Chenopodium quinoa]|uniref:uncharacterized protein LOC110710813 n=1 Tax=Chenopodium quinoa TaxID=63459 RepID=UPI000B76C025|nr:uncharacterized protein LOC110710813 [Chenopodium quinoa]